MDKMRRPCFIFLFCLVLVAGSIVSLQLFVTSNNNGKSSFLLSPLLTRSTWWGQSENNNNNQQPQQSDVVTTSPNIINFKDQLTHIQSRGLLLVHVGIPSIDNQKEIQTLPEWNLNDIYPNWKEIIWSRTFNGYQQQQQQSNHNNNNNTILYNVVGSKYKHKHSLCNFKLTNEQNIVRMIFSPWGLGSNMINSANNIIYTAMHGKKFVYVSLRLRLYSAKVYEEYRKTLNPWELPVPMQRIYEDYSSFPVEDETLCINWNDVCRDNPKRCLGPTKNERAIQLIQTLKRTKPMLLGALRCNIIRELTRLKPKPLQQMNHRVQEIFPQLIPSLEKTTTTNSTFNKKIMISLHIRRGDKIGREADLTLAHTYVEAILIVLEDLFAGKLTTLQLTYQVADIYILTDDSTTKQEIQAQWDIQTLNPQTKFHARNTIPTRTDKFGDRAQPHLFNNGKINMTKEEESFMDLLVDIKVMVLTHLFIGTQTSQLSEVACYLRGGMGCYDAESGLKNRYRWDHSYDNLV
jgi:hypothetical protein